MILNPRGNIAVTSCGWTDKSCLKLIDIDNQQEKIVQVGDAEYLGLKKASDNHFVVIQHFKGERLVISIHSFDRPEIKSAEVAATSRHLEFSGDLKLWDLVPRYYVAYLKDEFQGGAYRLIEIDTARKDMLFSDIEWFDNSYDQGYQGIMDVIQIPGTNNLLYSIQRDSRPVLYDIVAKKVVQKIKLADRAGNPVFTFRSHGKELWCIDYDTLLKLNVADWKIMSAKRLQAASLGMTMQFLGDFSFTPNEQYCAVARPFNNDVLLLDSGTFKICACFKSRYQPLSLAVTDDLRLVLRDWKSGALEYGLLKPKKKFWIF